MLNRELPFLRLSIPFCSGIVSGLFFSPSPAFFLVSLSVLIIGFLTSTFFNRREYNRLYGFPLTFGFFLAGLWLYSHEKNSLSELSPSQNYYLGSLSEYPEERQNNLRLIVRLYGYYGENGIIPVKGSILLYSEKDTSLKRILPGDFLKIRCKPLPIENKGNPYEFDYRSYMENHGIRYFSFVSSDDIIAHRTPEHRKLKHKALIVRERIIAIYKDLGIEGERLALVAAITLGEKRMLDPEQKQVFINAGVMHIMAVSGLHAVILSLFIFRMLFFIGKRFEILRILIAVLLLWGFAFITGMTPSVIRATLMFSFLQAGRLFKRNVNSINSVLTSAFILMAGHPSVIFDAGFLLSYSSVLFIVCFYQDTYHKIKPGSWLADKIWQSVAVTILAQAGTLPLTISLFNRFPTWFILSNIIIVPVSSILIIMGCLVPLVYPIKLIAKPLASALGFLTGLTEDITEKAASLPFATIDNLGLTPIETILLFITIFITIIFLTNRESISVKIPIFSIIAFLVSGSIICISDKLSSELLVYNVPGRVSFAVRTGKTLRILCDDPEIPPEVKRHAAMKRLRIESCGIQDNSRLILAGNKRILVSGYLSHRLIEMTRPDHIILTGKPLQSGKFSIQVNNLKIKSLVITSSVRFNNLITNETYKSLSADTIHYIRKSGAFRVRL